jgi:hypothetical protein
VFCNMYCMSQTERDLFQINISSLSSTKYKTMWDFRFSRRWVWNSESSGMYCHVLNLMSTYVSAVRAASIIRAIIAGSTYLWHVGRHSINDTAVHPRRFWALKYKTVFNFVTFDVALTFGLLLNWFCLM